MGIRLARWALASGVQMLSPRASMLQRISRQTDDIHVFILRSYSGRSTLMNGEMTDFLGCKENKSP
jgi:hypothetical protein